MRKAEDIPAGYTAGAHVARTSTLAGLLLAGAGWLARGAPPRAWLLVPAFWLFANFFEWTVHRYPMHRPMFPRVMYRNHAGVHHGAFTETTMEIHSSREMWFVMMPWYTLVMLLVGASPVAIAAGVLGGAPIAGIFYVAALSYFLFYETMHALYHLPLPTLARLGLRPGGLFHRLRTHHARHHIPRLMARYNFNVTVPLADTVMGTRLRDADVAAASAGHEPAGGRGGATSSPAPASSLPPSSTPSSTR
jgi:hypothetical protein